MTLDQSDSHRCLGRTNDLIEHAHGTNAYSRHIKYSDTRKRVRRVYIVSHDALDAHRFPCYVHSPIIKCQSCSGGRERRENICRCVVKMEKWGQVEVREWLEMTTAESNNDRITTTHRIYEFAISWVLPSKATPGTYNRQQVVVSEINRIVSTTFNDPTTRGVGWLVYNERAD